MIDRNVLFFFNDQLYHAVTTLQQAAQQLPLEQAGKLREASELVEEVRTWLRDQASA